MIPSDCGDVLRACAFYDNRKVTDEAAVAWSAAIDKDVSKRDALEAVVAHYADSADWLGPSHINQRARAVRRERLQRAGDPPIPGDLTHAHESTWRHLWCSAVKDGHPDPERAASDQLGIATPTLLPPDPERLRAILATSKSVPA
jgi:hypothetical protein